MKVHHALNSRSVRVWLLTNLNYPTMRSSWDKSMRTPEYLKIHPLAVCLLWKITGSQFLNQSNNSICSLKVWNGRLPGCTSEYPYTQWLHYAEGMIMPQVNIIVVETIFLPEERRNQTNVDRATKLLSRMLTAIDLHMENREFLAGEFSGADIMI